MLIVIINSSSEKPFCFRNAISSFGVLISPGFPEAVVRLELLTGEGRPTGSCTGAADFILGTGTDGVKAPRCNAGVLVFCNGGGDSGHSLSSVELA